MAFLPLEAPRPPEHIVFVGNLSIDATDEALFSFFGPLTVRKVRLVRDPRSGESRGFAFVEFISHSAAEDAVRLSGEMLLGRAIDVERAIRR